MQDELQAACEDFEEALLGEGPSAGLASLASFARELKDAPAEAVDRLLAAFEHALANVCTGTAMTESGWTEHAQVRAALHAIVAGHPGASARLRRVWQACLGDVLLGRGPVDAADHFGRIAAVSRWASDAVAGAMEQISGHNSVDHDATVLAVMRSLAYFHVLHPDCIAPASVDELLGTLFAPSEASGAADLGAVVRRIEPAFQAVTETLQAAGVLECFGTGDAQAQRSLLERAWQWLERFQRGSPVVADAWWGAYAAALYHLLAVARQHGGLRAALDRHAVLRAVVGTLCHAASAHMMVRYLAADPGGEGGSEGATRALLAAEALLQGDHAALLAGCAVLLTPEVNATLQYRQEAVRVMSVAAARFLEEQGEDRAAQSRLWPQPLLEVLMFALSRDPSLRIRREAVKLLSSVRAMPASPEEAGLLRALCLRARDKDAAVRQEAFSLLLQFPDPSLRAGLTLADWRSVMDIGLAPCSSAVDRGGHVERHHLAAAHTAATQLLQRFLFWDATDEGAGSWVSRLQALMGPGFGCGGSGAALGAAYSAALGRIIMPGHILEATGGGM